MLFSKMLTWLLSERFRIKRGLEKGVFVYVHFR